MRVPTAEELAAIAAAYVVATRPRETPARAVSRWALAGRIDADDDAARSATGRTRRWSIAARLPH